MKINYLTMVVFIVVASGIWTLLRTNGMTGDCCQYLAWRWAETKEEMLLAQDSNGDVLLMSDIAVADTISEWPGFCGTNRDGTVKGFKMARSTPTLAGNHVYSLGATGILNVLDAGTGSVIWLRDASAMKVSKFQAGVLPLPRW